MPDATILSTQTLLTQIQTDHTNYLAMKSAQAATISENEGMTREIQELGLQLRELNRVEATLDAQYLDQKENPGAKTFWGRLGLSNIQDWSLAFFFFSYGVLVFVIWLSTVNASKYPLRYSVFVLIVGGFLALIIAFLIRAVA